MSINKTDSPFLQAALVSSETDRNVLTRSNDKNLAHGGAVGKQETYKQGRISVVALKFGRLPSIKLVRFLIEILEAPESQIGASTSFIGLLTSHRYSGNTRSQTGFPEVEVDGFPTSRAGVVCNQVISTTLQASSRAILRYSDVSVKNGSACASS